MKILVVEDDPTSRKVLTAILAKDGHHTVTADNGLDAQAVFERERPDLVMMDVMMPVMDGYEAARLIKQRCGSRFTPLIFLTALTDDTALAKCVESGGDDFLPKPYNRVLIKAKVDAMDRIRSLHRVTAEQHDALEQYQLTSEEEMRLARHVFDRATSGSSSHGACIRYLGWSVGRWSGDFLIQAQTPSGRIHAMLGDFTGHGLAAAVGTLPAADTFRVMTKKDFPIDAIAAEISSKLRASLPMGYFCAAALVSIDREQGEAAVGTAACRRYWSSTARAGLPRAWRRPISRWGS